MVKDFYTLVTRNKKVTPEKKKRKRKEREYGQSQNTVMFQTKGKNILDVRREVSISEIYSVGDKLTIPSKPDSCSEGKKMKGVLSHTFQEVEQINHEVKGTMEDFVEGGVV